MQFVKCVVDRLSCFDLQYLARPTRYAVALCKQCYQMGVLRTTSDSILPSSRVEICLA